MEDTPIELVHVWTNSENAFKLKVNRTLMPIGETREYSNSKSVTDSSLAQTLFGIEGVESIKMDSISIEIFLSEDVDWNRVVGEVPAIIKTHLESGLVAVEIVEPSEEKKHSFGFKVLDANSHTPEEQFIIIKDLLDAEINPAVAAHGGYFDLISVEDNNVYVQLGGGCQGCGMADVTLRQGVEHRMKEVLPEMIELIDVTDHRAGTNPYYQPGK